MKNIQLFNNGYVVQSLHSEPLVSSREYRGIENYTSWPLEEFDDAISRDLTNEAWEKWFSFYDTFELVPDKSYLERYIRQCNKLKLNVMVIQIETPFRSKVTPDYLKAKEVLGYDCITGVRLSYLTLESAYFQKYFNRAFNRLNKNGLLSNVDDFEEFLETYNDLLMKGENLENSGDPCLALLSIVELS